MKKITISLRMRLTLITSLILTLLCAAFTVFSIYNANSAIAVMTPAGEIVPTVPSYNLYGSLDSAQESIPAIPIEPLITNTSSFSYYSILFMVGAIIIGSLIMYFVSGLVLKPLKKLAGTVARIDKDALSTRITDFNANDELSELSGSFNNMMSELESAFQREQRFSAAAAHEMKTPLTVIKTNLDVLAMDETPCMEDVNYSIEVVRKQTDRMSQLVNNLMELSGGDTFEKSDIIDAERIIKEIVTELEPQALERKITIEVSTAPYKFQGNFLMFKHALSNIITNAIRYNVDGGRVVISTQKDKGFSVRVADTGIGIAEEHIKNIFEPFYRVDKSRSRSAGGAGLGLAIANEIINKHGGTISCEKNEPHGSIFIITLTN